MKTSLYKSIALFFLVTITVIANAQQDSSMRKGWFFGVNSGLFVYQGDLTSAVGGSWKTVKPGMAFSLSNQLNKRLSVQFALSLAGLEGDDTKYQAQQDFRAYRQFYFRSTIAELSVSENLYLIKRTESGSRFSPYISAGIGGLFILKHERNFSNTDFSYFSASNLQAKLKEDSAMGVPKAILSVPVGLGFEYNVNDRLHFNLEGLYRFTSSDYLDGFSRSGNNTKNDYFYGISIGAHIRLGKGSSKPSHKPLPDAVTHPLPVIIPSAEVQQAKFADEDKDGIADSIDRCPTTAGTLEFYGCPPVPVRKKTDTVVVIKEPVLPVASALPVYTVYFAYDRSNLDGNAFTILNEVIRQLKADTALKVSFRGHTDMAGSVEMNYKLSLKRATICADYLISYGISPARIKTESYSKLQPVDASPDERVQWKNRRTEVVLVKE